MKTMPDGSIICFGQDGRLDSKTHGKRGWFKWWPSAHSVSELVHNEEQAEALSIVRDLKKISKYDQ